MSHVPRAQGVDEVVQVAERFADDDDVVLDERHLREGERREKEVPVGHYIKRRGVATSVYKSKRSVP